jgi:hypothetical protein
MSETLPVLRHSTAAAEWATSTERTPLFALVRPVERDGVVIDETVEYTMPAKPNPGLALEYLRRARREGELAMSWLIETAIGEEGYDALIEDLVSYEGNPTDLLRQIVTKIQKVAMGGLDGGPKA